MRQNHQFFIFQDIEYTQNELSNLFANFCYFGDIEHIEEMRKSNLLHICDVESGFMFACTTNRIEVVKYLLTNEQLERHPSLYSLYREDMPEGILIEAAHNCSYDVIHYLLYEHRYAIEPKTKLWLERENYKELLEMIEKRDLYFKIEDELEHHQYKNKNKI